MDKRETLQKSHRIEANKPVHEKPAHASRKIYLAVSFSRFKADVGIVIVWRIATRWTGKGLRVCKKVERPVQPRTISGERKYKTTTVKLIRRR